MLGAFTGWTSADGLAVRTTLDPVEQSFLDHHRIDGTPVLPGVMGIEGFAEVGVGVGRPVGRPSRSRTSRSWRRASSTGTNPAPSSSDGATVPRR